MGLSVAWSDGMRLRASADANRPMHYDSKGRLVCNKTGKQVWGNARKPRKESFAQYKARMKRMNIHV